MCTKWKPYSLNLVLNIPWAVTLIFYVVQLFQPLSYIRWTPCWKPSTLQVLKPSVCRVSFNQLQKLRPYFLCIVADFLVVGVTVSNNHLMSNSIIGSRKCLTHWYNFLRIDHLILFDYKWIGKPWYKRTGKKGHICCLKKCINRNKCVFATKQHMFGVLAIIKILHYRRLPITDPAH